MQSDRPDAGKATGQASPSVSGRLRSPWARAGAVGPARAERRGRLPSACRGGPGRLQFGEEPRGFAIGRKAAAHTAAHTPARGHVTGRGGLTGPCGPRASGRDARGGGAPRGEGRPEPGRSQPRPKDCNGRSGRASSTGRPRRRGDGWPRHHTPSTWEDNGTAGPEGATGSPCRRRSARAGGRRRGSRGVGHLGLAGGLEGGAEGEQRRGMA